MEVIKLQQLQVLKAHAQLKHMIYKLQAARTDSNKDVDDIIAYRDSLIKRFEISYDLTWKFLKSYLEKKYGISIASPKKVFQECFKQAITNETETRLLLDMADDRNSTTHTYNEALADDISLHISDYYNVISEIVAKITISSQ